MLEVEKRLDRAIGDIRGPDEPPSEVALLLEPAPGAGESSRATSVSELAPPPAQMPVSLMGRTTLASLLTIVASNVTSPLFASAGRTLAAKLLKTAPGTPGTAWPLSATGAKVNCAADAR